MRTNYNVTGKERKNLSQKIKTLKSERKNLVEAIAAITGEKAKYQGAPTFSYKIGAYTNGKGGTLICEDSKEADMLVEKLVDRSFAPADESFLKSS